MFTTIRKFILTVSVLKFSQSILDIMFIKTQKNIILMKNTITLFV